MRVAVVGATGVLGRQVVPLLLERGHTVSALARSESQAASFRRTEVRPVLGDIFRQESLEEVTKNSDVVLHLATAIPREGSAATWHDNDRIRRLGTKNLLLAAHTNQSSRYIQQSITLLYGQSDEPLNEDAELNPAPFIQSALDMENLVKGSKLDWCILRGGVFYGPGTGTEEGWRRAARTSSLRYPGDGSGFISLVHVFDMARAVVRAAEQAAPHNIFNVVDSHPVTYRELFGYIAAQEGASAPEPGAPQTLPSLACSSNRIRSELGWSPVFSTFRTGLAASHRGLA